jgi:glyceraldehyde 3-phosphate dehydrogenase
MSIAINGMGRIGRLVLRAAFGGMARDSQDPRHALRLPICHVNDSQADAALIAHLTEFDSVHGRWPARFAVQDGLINIEGQEISCSAESDPGQLDWAEKGAEIVLDCTGSFRKPDLLEGYFRRGVKKVIIAAPVHDREAVNIVVGVNSHIYQPDRHHILTAASCTTNCLAPIVKVLHEQIGIKRGQITTIHDPTNTNVVTDRPHKDWRRARAALLSLQPTSTGSARAIGLIYPELDGLLNGHAVRVPVLNSSLTDCVFDLAEKTDAETVNALFHRAAQTDLAGILGVESRPLVSADFVNDSRSSIIDLPSTMVTDDTLVKVYAWYDNETGYACRMVDLADQVLQAGW